MTMEDRSDEDLLAEATRLYERDLLLEAARLLHTVQDTSKFLVVHRECLRRAAIMEKLRSDLTAPSSEGWTKQGESHGHRDFIVYYKIEDNGLLKCRIESVIEASLFVPFLSTMNETDLYDEWFPKWSYPFKLGIRRSVKLAQRARVDQVVQLTVDLPLFMSNREVVFWAFADDDGPATRTVAAKLLSVDSDFDYGSLVPEVERNVVRIDFEADLLFRPCPVDHPALVKSEAYYPENEGKILVTVVLFVDPKVSFVPRTFLNFVTRTAMGDVWKMFLRVSEEVRDGKRPAHSKRIADKHDEIYGWIQEQSKWIMSEV